MMHCEIEELRIKNLFRHVLLQAMLDYKLLPEKYKNRGSRSQHIFNYNQAQSFLNGGRDLEDVCELADVDYKQFSDRVKDLKSLPKQELKNIFRR